MFNIKFANDWIRTTDLWCWKQQLYQLSHNHCPSLDYSLLTIFSASDECESIFGVAMTKHD